MLDQSGSVPMRPKLSTTPKAMREAYGAMQRAENGDALAVGEKVPERVGESAGFDPGTAKTSVPLLGRIE